MNRVGPANGGQPVRDEQNRPDSVQYQELIPLLLQQWKAQQAEISQLRTQVAQQRGELAALRQALATRFASLRGAPPAGH